MYFTVTNGRKESIIKIMKNGPYFGIKPIYSFIQQKLCHQTNLRIILTWNLVGLKKYNLVKATVVNQACTNTSHYDTTL